MSLPIPSQLDILTFLSSDNAQCAVYLPNDPLASILIKTVQTRVESSYFLSSIESVRGHQFI